MNVARTMQRYSMDRRDNKGKDDVVLKDYFDVIPETITALIQTSLGAAAAALIHSQFSDLQPLSLMIAGAAFPGTLRSLGNFPGISELILPPVDPLPLNEATPGPEVAHPQISQIRQEIEELRRISSNDDRIQQLEMSIAEIAERIQRELSAKGQQDQQQTLLISMYNQGLTAAKASFRMSVAAEVAGALIIFTGISMALFKDPAQGKSYTSIVTMASGAIVNLLGGVFLAQTNQARKHLSSLAVMLREDLQISWRVAKALSIADAVSTPDKRDAIYENLATGTLAIAPTTEPKGDNNSDTSTGG
ncbi:hypothetical protein ABZY05_05240 [Streptomyces canus]|uniref:TRADD-N-associated membrane domain-containing protein n=1 Tax=Streptomyces canus TaxID=58343 RepID=UPI0033A60462